MTIEIADRLVKLRKKYGYSQEELADKLGLSRQAVSKWERAEASPDTDNLICLAKLYGVSLDELLATDEDIDTIVQEQVKEEAPAQEEKVEINKDETSAVLKIKIFEMRNEINTDVKSYIRELNKYFKPYVRQNVDNGSRIDILGYSVNQRSVYVTVRMKVDLIDSENFSINETANIIKMYIEIFRTFAEQYQNIV